MRKRTISFRADTIFWYLIYFFPCICFLLYLIAEPSSGTQVINFATFFENLGFGFATDNIVVSCLTSIFGASGILPLFSSDTVFIIFSWFICTFLCHLLVDFLLFIPRLCHKFMDCFVKGD